MAYPTKVPDRHPQLPDLFVLKACNAINSLIDATLKLNLSNLHLHLTYLTLMSCHQEIQVDLMYQIQIMVYEFHFFFQIDQKEYLIAQLLLDDLWQSILHRTMHEFDFGTLASWYCSGCSLHWTEINNRLISQIPQCTCPIYHNIPLWNRIVHISVPKWCIVGYGTGAL